MHVPYIQCIIYIQYTLCNIIGRRRIPCTDNRWHGNPRKHSPSSSNSDSMTNGGANAVTIRNTERARADRPALDWIIYV